MPPGFRTRKNEINARALVDTYIKNNQLSNQICLVDRAVGHNAMVDFFRASDCVLVPSIEGFGLVYLEAMHCGLPIVGVSAGASQEFARSSGLWVPEGPDLACALARSIEHLAASTEARQQLGESGRITASENHLPHVWISKVEEDLLLLVSRAGSARGSTREGCPTP
jgi:glycosyltransferase involved in cell wall biosynthesis